MMQSWSNIEQLILLFKAILYFIFLHAATLKREVLE